MNGRPGRPEPPILEASGTPIDRIKGRLVSWLKAQIDSPETQEPLQLTISQVAKYDGHKVIEGGEIDFDWSKETPEQCAHEIIMAAIEDMDSANFTSDVAYSVEVEGREGRHNFTLKASRRAGPSGTEMRGRDHHPTMEGLTAQMMEQNLHLTDKVVTTASANVEMLMRTIAMRDEEILFLKKGQYQRDAQIQKMLSGEVQRRIMIEEHEAKMEQSAKVADGIKAAIPGLAAILGGPQAAAAIAMLMPQNSGGGDGGGGGAGGDLALAGFEGPPDLRLIDEFVMQLESKPDLRAKVFQALASDADVLGLLAKLYELSKARREARATAQAEAAAERREEENGRVNSRGRGYSEGFRGQGL